MAALTALLASLLWGTADFLGGTAARRLPVASVLGVSQLVALLGLVPLAASLGAFDEPPAYVLPGLGAGLAGMVALGAFYRALATGTMGVIAPIAALGVVVPIGLGLLDGEHPTLLQLVGMAVAVVGVVLASGPELSGRGRGGALPLLLAGVAALGFGTVLVLVAVASGGEDGTVGAVVMTLLTMRLASVLTLTVLLLVFLRSRGGDIAVRRGDLPVLMAIGAFDVGANGAYALASQSELVSVAAVLASLYPVVTVLLARRFHAERLARVQLGGVALALTGVVALAAG
ncbi:MAG: EamA family transporter [Mycobacteriales bacterium]